MYGVASNSSYIYTTNDGGTTWIQRVASTGFSSATSSTGQYMYVGQWPGYMQVSADYGATWNSYGTNTYYQQVSCSANGQIVYAPDYNSSGTMVKSSNYGVSWGGTLSTFPGTPWYVTCDQTGNIVYGADQNGYIYKSTSGGNAWAQVSTLINRAASGLSCSADGQTIIASAGTIVYLSTDGGTTWSTPTLGGASYQWPVVSRNGQHIIGISNTNPMYVSHNSGLSFQPESLSGRNVCLSADGSRAFQAMIGNYIQQGFVSNAMLLL
jgi:photosystem II stability/assembly factor-like uncharacterized protein